MKSACADCQHFTRLPSQPGEGAVLGRCRRNPPQIVATMLRGPKGEPVVGYQSDFPRVVGSWACGEFKPKLVVLV